MGKKAGIVVISNPTAGQRSGGFVKAVLRELMERGHIVELRITERPGHATEIARTWAADADIYLIVAAGGDGTIREVAEGLVGTNVPLGIIPAGTANVLARELGYLKAGQRRVRRTASILEGSHDEHVYPFTVELPDREMLGLCWVGAGFDAEVLKHVDPVLKKKLGRSAFVSAIVKTLWREPAKPSVPWEFSAGDAGTCGWGLVANIGKYAGPFRVTRQTSLTERGLACLLFEQAGWLARAIDQIVITFKPLDQRGKTRVLKEGSLIMGTTETPIQLDGDLVGSGPVKISPLKAALSFKAANGD